MWSLLVLAAVLQRPTLPEFPAVPPSSICEDVQARQAWLKSPPSQLAGEYTEAMTAYLNARMGEIGMTKEEQGALALRILRDAEFEAAGDRNLKAARTLIEGAGKMMIIKDEAARCRLALDLMRRMPEILIGAEQQWSIMDRAIDAEAARRAQSTQ